MAFLSLHASKGIVSFNAVLKRDKREPAWSKLLNPLERDIRAAHGVPIVGYVLQPAVETISGGHLDSLAASGAQKPRRLQNHILLDIYVVPWPSSSTISRIKVAL